MKWIQRINNLSKCSSALLHFIEPSENHDANSPSHLDQSLQMYPYSDAEGKLDARAL